VTKYTGNMQEKELLKLRLEEFLNVQVMGYNCHSVSFLYILNADGSLKGRQLFMREEEK